MLFTLLIYNIAYLVAYASLFFPDYDTINLFMALQLGEYRTLHLS